MADDEIFHVRRAQQEHVLAAQSADTRQRVLHEQLARLHEAAARGDHASSIE